MKKLITLVSAIVLVFSISACSNGEGKLDIPETPASDFEYKYDAAVKGVMITKYKGDSIKVRIPRKIEGEPVTAIGEMAFRESDVMQVYLHDGITNIGEGAFYDSTGLTTLTIPKSVTEIGESAFAGCTSLTSVAIPEGVTEIGEGAFFRCAGLTDIIIPKSVTEIADGMFMDCISLTDMKIPDSITKIGKLAFAGCEGLTSVTFPKGVAFIDERAFSGCTSLTSVAIPEGVTVISDSAFYGCTGLISITIPESVTTIEMYAFYGCTTLTDVIIPKSVTEIGMGAFKDCPNLTSVTILGNPKIDSIMEKNTTYGPFVSPLPFGVFETFDENVNIQYMQAAPENNDRKRLDKSENRNSTGETNYISPAANPQIDAGISQNEMEKTLNTDNIYDNIFISGINVGSKSIADATALLNEKLVAPLGNNSVKISCSGEEYDFSFSYFNIGYNIQTALSEAYSYARSGHLEDRYTKIASLKQNPFEITAELTFDANSVRRAVASIEDEVNTPAKDASMQRVNGQFIVTREVNGKKIDVAETALLIADVLASKESGTVNAIIREEMPRYHENDMLNARSLLGTYTTKAAVGDANRDANIANAVSKINNAVVYPGEVFSVNKYFGEITVANGYNMANIDVDGRLENEMGGGISQVSTTLYMALLYAELEIVERHNHFYKVSYADYSFDAALVGDYIDLKFKNDTAYLITIESIMRERDVTVNIYGYEVHTPGRTLRFANNLLSTTPAPETIIIENNDMPLGFEKIEVTASDGYRYELIKTVFENDISVSSSIVNRSTYKPRAEEKHVGVNSGIPLPAIP